MTPEEDVGVTGYQYDKDGYNGNHGDAESSGDNEEVDHVGNYITNWADDLWNLDDDASGDGGYNDTTNPLR
jgi:hypothetical protein